MHFSPITYALRFRSDAGNEFVGLDNLVYPSIPNLLRLMSIKKEFSHSRSISFIISIKLNREDVLDDILRKEETGFIYHFKVSAKGRVRGNQLGCYWWKLILPPIPCFTYPARHMSLQTWVHFNIKLTKEDIQDDNLEKG